MKKLKKARLLLLLGTLLFLIGASGMGTTYYYSWKLNHARQFAVPTEVVKAPIKPATKQGFPSRLVIPSVSIDLPVIEGTYNPANAQWTLTLDKVQFASAQSQLANDEQGNTFMYGHYRKGVFLYLPRIQEGALATVDTTNNLRFTYRFRSSKVTDPTDTSLFAYTGKPILTLQTCSGAWYQNRQLFTFDLVDVQAIPAAN